MTYDQAKEIATAFMVEKNPDKWEDEWPCGNPRPDSFDSTSWSYKIGDDVYLNIVFDFDDGWRTVIKLIDKPFIGEDLCRPTKTNWVSKTNLIATGIRTIIKRYEKEMIGNG